MSIHHTCRFLRRVYLDTPSLPALNYHICCRYIWMYVRATREEGGAAGNASNGVQPPVKIYYCALSAMPGVSARQRNTAGFCFCFVLRNISSVRAHLARPSLTLHENVRTSLGLASPLGREPPDRTFISALLPR